MRAFQSFHRVGFSYKYVVIGKTLTLMVDSANLNLLFFEREVRLSLLFLRRTKKKKKIGEHLLHPSLKPSMASTGLAFNFVSLEVLGSHLCMVTVRDEPSKSRSTKVYHLLNSWFWFWFVLMNYDGPMGGIPPPPPPPPPFFFFCFGIRVYIFS